MSESANNFQDPSKISQAEDTFSSEVSTFDERSAARRAARARAQEASRRRNVRTLAAGVAIGAVGLVGGGLVVKAIEQKDAHVDHVVREQQAPIRQTVHENEIANAVHQAATESANGQNPDQPQ